MSGATILMLVVGAIAIAAASRRWGWPTPLVLVVAGLALSFVPGIPNIELDPDIVLFGVLPPLLFNASLDTSYLNLRANFRPVALLSIGLVLFTTVTVGVVAYLVVGHDLGWALALVLGAVVSPPDAVATTAIARNLRLPRRILTILGGESLLNDATALTAYRVALGAVGATVSVWHGVGLFALAVVVGVGIGLVLGIVGAWLLCRLSDPLVEVAIFLILPFGAYALAEELHGSGVLSVVAAGILLGRKMPKMHYATRLQGASVTATIDFVLETLVFGLIGLQLPSVIQNLTGRDPGTVTGLVVAVVLTVLVTRIVWMFPATYLPRKLSKKISAREKRPSLAQVTIISWAGMRGVVTLAAAYAIPVTVNGEKLPGRDLVLLCSFAVVLATLLLQGLTLPWLIRRVHLPTGEDQSDALAEAQAAQQAAQAAVERLEEIAQAELPDSASIVDDLRNSAESRANAAWERLGPQGEDRQETPSELYRRLRRDMLNQERTVYIGERDRGRIDDEVLRRVQRELDLEEAMLDR
ncbi:sodium/proton antiporter, CPA1 family [Nakamurella panacisegetis]|uniref:Sodium/proton antiporter, CPA1 family n=1 Tax=Nakamurella panacisegetis TaxID=1090615 RepID=A0A1H0KH46_9ACTN|nr:Na+/H+ antiporter [Nakamurella panacisegetis]SDO55153.1 sodium/proton antiporter, CPA1 family [Nakamurella panacisegetis]